MTFVNKPGAPRLLPGLLRAHPLLQDLDPEALHGLCAQAQVRRMRAAEVLFHEGDPAQHWFFIEAGQVEVVRYCCEGNERVFHRFEAGQCIAEAAMFMTHRRYPMQARTVGRATLWRLERQALQQTCAQHPALALRLLEDFSRRIYHYVNEIEWLTVSTAPQRLAACLLRLSEQQGPRLELPGSQRQLAASLGIRPETLSRLLAQWQARQWLRGERRDWTLLDTAPLQRLAGAQARAF